MMADDRRYNLLTPTGPGNEWTPLSESNLRNTLNSWWGANVSDSLRNVAIPVGNLDENSGNSISVPSEGVVAENGSNTLFILSCTETENYFSNNASRIGFDANGDSRNWFLRSFTHNPVGPIAGITNEGGNWSHTATFTGTGLRPVMWIRNP